MDAYGSPWPIDRSRRLEGNGTSAAIPLGRPENHFACDPDHQTRKQSPVSLVHQLRQIGLDFDEIDAIPFWNLLSAIYALTEEEHVKLRATDAYAFAGGSATTGKRKLVALIRAKMVLTARNPAKRNEKFVSIADDARGAVFEPWIAGPISARRTPWRTANTNRQACMSGGTGSRLRHPRAIHFESAKKGLRPVGGARALRVTRLSRPQSRRAFGALRHWGNRVWSMITGRTRA